MLKLKLAAVGTLLALSAIPAAHAADPVSPGEIRADKREIVQDRREIRGDKREIRQDMHERNQDRRELRREVRAGDQEGAREARRFIGGREQRTDTR